MKKILLLILDGFGLRENTNGNAISMSNIPNIKKIMEEYQVCKLEASGSEVGLIDNEPGNSIVGHTTIGMGKIIKQPLSIINDSIKDKSFFENDTLLDLMDYVNDNKSTLHIITMISSSSENSNLEHIYATIALCKIRKVKDVIFHFITDGKDGKQMEALDIIDNFMNRIEKLEIGRIGTICGRYYVMNNDSNHDKIKKSYDLIAYNIGNSFTDYNRCLSLHYKNNITDEFINPSVLIKGSNIKDGDGILFLDYNLELMKEFVLSFTNKEFNLFNTKKFNNIKCVSLFKTFDDLDYAFDSDEKSISFGKYLCDLDFKQARIAESEKYLNVTYFFDGKKDLFDKNIHKVIVPSQKVVRADIKPEMCVSDITEETMKAMEEDYDFILTNFTNPDSLGHTGNLTACIRGLESIDEALSQIIDKANDNFYDVVITSTHGNVEYMKDVDGNINISNTTNKVPFIILNKDYKLKENGSLKDIIPTIIDMYEISKPKEMTGESLIIKE